MPRKKAVKASASVSEPKTGLKFDIQPEREKEFRRKLTEANEYFARAFGAPLSVAEVFQILKDHIEAEKRRVFLKRVEPVSEADVLWFEANVLGEEGEAQEPESQDDDAGGDSSDGNGDEE